VTRLATRRVGPARNLLLITRRDNPWQTRSFADQIKIAKGIQNTLLKLDPFKPAIDEMLKADLDAPRKQRHTVTRIWHRLMDEHGMADVPYPVVRAYVAERKPQVLAEAGEVPAGKIRYDNLKSGVAQVIGFSRSRVGTDRWTAFRSHWGLEAFYCRPGIEGAHEKGGVEGQIGWFRRRLSCKRRRSDRAVVHCPRGR
jgi:hypothetical protein